MLEASFGDMNQYDPEYLTQPPPHARKGPMPNSSMNNILLGPTNTHQSEEYRSLQENDPPRRQRSHRAPRKQFSLSDAFKKCFNRRKNNEAAGPRLIYINSTGLNEQQKFLHNRVFTAKYSPLTFLPKFLYIEFSKYANLFFLFISGIQVKILYTSSVDMSNFEFTNLRLFVILANPERFPNIQMDDVDSVGHRVVHYCHQRTCRRLGRCKVQ
jgi:Phospholipid-translocating ATPase N-terminal